MFKMKDLEPAGYNPREIDAEALEGLTNSISRFGCVEPIVVNTRGRHNVIVGGN
jgi:ParB-like chromosome segregation protein Spo0J